MPTLGQDFGRLFEVGFNAGLLTAMQQQQMPLPHHAPYHNQLSKIRLTPLLGALTSTHGIVSDVDHARARQWVTWYVFRGWIAGLNLWKEYVASLNERTLPQLRYVQAQFTDENSLHTVAGGIGAQRAVLAQLPWPDIDAVQQRARARGLFLNADTLVWLQCRDHDRLLVIDLSAFQVTTGDTLPGINDVDVLRRMLQQDIAYHRTKSAFGDLSLDLDPLDVQFAHGLGRLIYAMGRRDKEVVKLIQAGSYAASFMDAVTEAGLLQQDRELRVTLAGYSDRGISALTVPAEHRRVLDECAEIYRQPRPHDARQHAYAQMERTMHATAARTLGPEGRAFVNALLTADPINSEYVVPISYTEKLTQFANVNEVVDCAILNQFGLAPNLPLRAAHAALVHRALDASAPTPLVVLSGHPGIGKTTAILNFLQAHADEGFMFLYVSPRTQVNDEVVATFVADEAQAHLPDVLALTTTSDLIRLHRGRPTVAYRWKQRHDSFVHDGVQFVPADGDVTQLHGHRSTLTRVRDDMLRPAAGSHAGVLASMGAALGAVLRHGMARQVVATVSIQALKQTARGTTLRHLRQIFRAARNERDGTMNTAAMRALAQERRHLFVMIDEIAGDASGPAFYHAIEALLREAEVLDGTHGFNTKLIVADASLATADVLQQHLHSHIPERPIVYVRRASAPPRPLSEEPIVLRRQPGVLINANAYPARSLTLRTNVLLDAIAVEEMDQHTLAQVHNRLLAVLEQDVLQLLADATTDQIIVYLQDKHRLHELTQRIGHVRAQQGQAWEAGEEYLLIHADLTPAQKREVRAQKQQARVVFMTASASRGLSFPRARHLLVGVPPFQIEQNLMEILQVLFRGRGGAFDTADKTVMLYLADRAIYDTPEHRRRALRDRAHTLLTTILLVRTAILTRISGAGLIGRVPWQIIPVGSRAVTAAGTSWSSTMTTLQRELYRAQLRDRSDESLRHVAAAMQTLLDRSELLLEPPPDASTQSYLTLLQSFATSFPVALERGFDRLLTLPALPPAVVVGSLLFVPLPDGALAEHYTMRARDALRTLTPALERQMWAMVYARDRYTERLRVALRAALELIGELRSTAAHTQSVEQQSARHDRYYVLPLPVFTMQAAFQAYYATQPDEPEEASFRELLEQYVRLLYPVEQVLPLGMQYNMFPFLVIQSSNLPLLRAKVFTDRQVLASTTFNVLNVLLAQPRP